MCLAPLSKCSVNCETKQFEYKAVWFYYEVWSCNVFICVVLGCDPWLFFFGGSLLTVFAWLTHTIWLCTACVSHHLASSKLHLTSFGLCYTAFTVLGKYWTLCRLGPWPVLTSFNLRSCPVQKSDVIFELWWIDCYDYLLKMMSSLLQRNQNIPAVICGFLSYCTITWN